jgi:hypothetical protein
VIYHLWQSRTVSLDCAATLDPIEDQRQAKTTAHRQEEADLVCLSSLPSLSFPPWGAEGGSKEKGCERQRAPFTLEGSWVIRREPRVEGGKSRKGAIYVAAEAADVLAVGPEANEPRPPAREEAEAAACVAAKQSAEARRL